jgi:hypothetical protein
MWEKIKKIIEKIMFIVGIIGTTIFTFITVIFFIPKKKNDIDQRKKENENKINNLNYDDINSNGTLKKFRVRKKR